MTTDLQSFPPGVMNVDAMKNNSRTQHAAATPGFATQIVEDTDLGIASLIVEDEEGRYEPVNFASTIAEGAEMAQADLRSRMRKLETGKDTGLCPFKYRLWARGIGGKLLVAATWNVGDF